VSLFRVSVAALENRLTHAEDFCAAQKNGNPIAMEASESGLGNDFIPGFAPMEMES
jgi:hypothetical protein